MLDPVNPVKIEIGSAAAERITITVIARSHPTATDYDDANWIRTSVGVRVAGFGGLFGADLRTEELESLRVQLSALYETLNGEATFETMEECVSLRFTGDGTGHVRVEAELRDKAGSGNLLRCALGLDQTDLPPIIKSLDAAAQAWPVIGRP